MDATAEHSLAIIPPTEHIREESYDFHHRFNEEVWGGQESFHNEKHIRAVGLVADILIDDAILHKDNDPLHLKAELEKWNASKPPELQINFDRDFKKAYRIAVSMHDWGNTTEELHEVGGVLIPKYLDGYKAAGAEDRAMKFAEFAIQNDIRLTDQEKERYIPFVRHLIDQTRFMYDKDDPNGEKPFARAMRFMDQIGNDLFTTNEDGIIGLMREQVYENPEITGSIAFYHNFARRRIDALVPKEDQERLFKVLGKELPPENTDYPDAPVKLADYLKAHDMVKRSPLGLTDAVAQQFKKETGKDIQSVLRPMRDLDEIRQP